MTALEESILRTTIALAVFGAPPTISELIQHLDSGAQTQSVQSPISEEFFSLLLQATQVLCDQGKLVIRRGRYLPSSLAAELLPLLQGEEWLPRKMRKAKRVARWLARLDGVRSVFLCNRTALGLPHDDGDLDFLVVVRHGSIWQTRGLAGLPFVLLGDRPKPGQRERDVVCLSFFLSDQALDLQTCALQPDDVYLRHWFLGLLPLVDDGVGTALWGANKSLRQRHEHARIWIPSPDLSVPLPSARIPVSHSLERLARHLQSKYFPRRLREVANLDTRVMISDSHLKFHIDDGRERLRDRYLELCATYGIAG